MNIAVWILVLYSIVWLILLFILAIAFADRPTGHRGDRAAEYLWNEQRVISIIVIVMTIMLPILIVWAIMSTIHEGRRVKYEFLVEQIGSNPNKYVIRRVKLKAKDAKETQQPSQVTSQDMNRSQVLI